MVLLKTDVFISRTLELLLANPSTTRISIIYSQSKSETKSIISFKSFDTKSGTLYKFKTNKSKDLSKVLTALGPHGVKIINGKTEKQVRGVSSILVNAEVEEEIEEKKIEEKPKLKTKKKKGKR